MLMQSCTLGIGSFAAAAESAGCVLGQLIALLEHPLRASAIVKTAIANRRLWFGLFIVAPPCRLTGDLR
jgi:hypothetical protein